MNKLGNTSSSITFDTLHSAAMISWALFPNPRSNHKSQHD
ncbi:hypothetical protein BTN50_0535 [Candidatus Enterovibrio altilux]|uniref:Uncharacterized protein n=1 Tax=Candidatus Enterovibrio altilux TaxID=1927128 RepID=A0A291B7S7_9GAMM|nr:hypothetical protein BTN50_0535 [Candidatus Enterovibrio luxaltus]